MDSLDEVGGARSHSALLGRGMPRGVRFEICTLRAAKGCQAAVLADVVSTLSERREMNASRIASNATAAGLHRFRMQECQDSSVSLCGLERMLGLKRCNEGLKIRGRTLKPFSRVLRRRS